MTIGEFSLHNPFNMRLYQKQIEIEREQEQHVPCLYFWEIYDIQLLYLRLTCF